MKKYLLLAVVIFAGWNYFQNKSGGQTSVDDEGPEAAALKTEIEPGSKAAAPVFQCDGRVYCSDMRSRAEAEFFVKHCPGTRMDGDGDGEPCENDSRF